MPRGKRNKSALPKGSNNHRNNRKQIDTSAELDAVKGMLQTRELLPRGQIDSIKGQRQCIRFERLSAAKDALDLQRVPQSFCASAVL